MPRLLLGLAFLILASFHSWDLFWIPPDALMGDVYRILFVHVPAAWVALALFSLSFFGSLVYIIRRRPAWDRLSVSAAELGTLFTGLTLILGSLWGRPTWGVWWTWDPRLTTTALLFILYVGSLVLRRLVGEPEKRKILSAAVGLLIFLNVPIVYLSVKWWRSLHQVQSSPDSMDPAMATALRSSAIALFLLAGVLLWIRMRLEARTAALEIRGGQL